MIQRVEKSGDVLDLILRPDAQCTCWHCAGERALIAALGTCRIPVASWEPVMLPGAPTPCLPVCWQRLAPAHLVALLRMAAERADLPLEVIERSYQEPGQTLGVPLRSGVLVVIGAGVRGPAGGEGGGRAN